MLLRALLGKTNLFMRWTFTMSSKNKKDLYQTLGVSKGATQSEIKKGYYKMAQELHPDKNSSPNAKDKFAEINNAYEVLSDQSKRTNYDRHGTTQENPFEGFQNEDIFSQFRQSSSNQRRGGGQHNMHDFQSIFQDIFGAHVGNNKRGRNKNASNHVNHAAVAEDIEYKIDLDFNESVNGTTKKIDIKRKCNCSNCKGTGAKPGTKPHKCHTCQGTGYMTIQQGIMIMRAQCMSCEGTGQSVGTPCNHCGGKGFQTAKMTQQIKFPKGIDNGSTLRFKGKGHLNGDLIIKVGVRKHPQFKRDGNDSLLQKQINIIDAVLGGQIQVQTIYGQNKKIKIPAGTQSGQKIKLPKEGFYKLNTSQKGNQLITVKVKIPTKLTTQEKKLFQKLRDLLK